MVVKVRSSSIAPVRGIGKPDYSRIVTAAKERRGIYLDYNQTLKTFSLVFSAVPSVFPWVVPLLAPGVMQHVIDCDTGLPTPFTVPVGYTFTIIAAATAVNNDPFAELFMDGSLVLSAAGVAGGIYYENKLVGVSSALVDPAALLPHTLDATLTNDGGGDIKGSVDYLAIIEAVGTEPLPIVKIVKCKWCGHEQEVPRETTSVTCRECGELFIVYDLSKLRRTP